MCPYDGEIEKIKNEIVEKFHPQKIILFGSCAKGLTTKKSDIDICVVAETDNKRKLVQNILLQVNYNVDLDVVIYTPEEWGKYKEDASCFANIISKTGVILFG